jgi:hypothetical protein
VISGASSLSTQVDAELFRFAVISSRGKHRPSGR